MSRDKSNGNIGSRIHKARDIAGLSVENLASIVGKSPALISQIENAGRSINSELVYKIARATGVSVSELYGEGSELDGDGSFSKVISFLKQAETFGVTGFHSNREAALGELAPWLENAYSGKVCINGSSFRGILQNSTNPLMRLLNNWESRETKHRGLEIQIIMTHPLFGQHRESLELRVPGSIVWEIIQGIRTLVVTFGIPEANIRFIRAAPTLFSVFCINRSGEGIGCLNPYPVMSQAFSSFSFVVRTSGTELGLSTKGERIFQSLYNNNFRAPFYDKNLAATLQQVIEECKKADERRIEDPSVLRRLKEEIVELEVAIQKKQNEVANEKK